MSKLYAKEVIKIAKAEVGYLEKKTNAQLDSKTANAGYGNFTKYARDFDEKYPDFYNGKKNGYDWCDMFVDWCFVKAFGVANSLKLLNQPQKSCGAGCPWSANYFRHIGRFSATAKVGDQIFFAGSNGSPCHTGIVYKVDDTYVYTVEGNTSSDSGVVANGGCVALKKYPKSSGYIYGYGRPDYDIEKSEKAELDTEGFQLGDKSVGVLALKQLLLQAHSLGTIKIKVKNDKGYGKGTQKAVNTILKKLGYKPNGIAGQKFIKNLGALIREGRIS